MTNLQKQCLLRIGCVVLAAIILACALITPDAAAKSTDEYYENAVLFWTNVERSRNGLPELKTTPGLQSAADVRVGEIASSFSHTRPNGTKWSTALKSEGVSYGSAAENISAGSGTPYETVYRWMNSSSHRANILNGSYGYMGAGYRNVSGSKYTHYWTQEFAGGTSPSNAVGSFYVAPTSVTTDKSSVKLSVGGTAQLSGIPSPVYATEEISCTSSNPAVVRVESVQVNVFTLKGVGNGTAELTVRCGSYTKTVTVKVGTGVNPEIPFADVSGGAVYYKAVLWAYENGITGGTDALHFSPNKPCTRAQVVTFLWRAAGCPQPKGESLPFTDVKSGSFCYKAVLWAYENGVTDGVDASHFAPARTVTRDQFVTMLWKYHGCPQVYCDNPFADLARGSYCYDAVLWAYKTGVTTGIDATHFGVGRPCLRYQVVLFLYRDLT